MNKIYRLVWNRQQGRFVVAQENAASRGKGSQAARVTSKQVQHAAAAALALAATLLATPASALNYNVSSPTDTGAIGTPSSLSWAIARANTGSGNSVFIDLPAGSAITLSGTLPTISQGVNLISRNAVQISGGTLFLGSGITGNISIGGNIGWQGRRGADLTAGEDGGIAVSGNSFALNNFGTIAGGDGGTGINNGLGGRGGNAVAGNGFTLNNSGNVKGGRGGDGIGGFGELGGVGVSGSGFSLINSGTITGGDGGNGGSGGFGGTAGVGVSGSGFTLRNFGTITSGNAGTGTVNGGAAAAVVSTGSATIYNSGTITNTGGADVVKLSGGNNKVVLMAGGQFAGNVVSTSGAGPGGDTFALGGASGSGSFDLADIGAKYQGFATFAKQDAGTWTLTGSGASDWTAQGGTLALADSASLTGALTVQSGASIVANNATVIGTVTNAGTFGVNAGKTATIDSYGGTGGVLRIGVAGMNSYGKLVVTGTANLNGSSLFVDAASASGMANGTLSQVISAGSIFGTFASTSTNSLLFTYTPVYVGNQIDLTVAAVPGNRIFDTTNAQGNFPAAGAAKVLDQIIGGNANGPIAKLFQGFTTGQERGLSNAVSQSLPLLAGGSQVATNSAFSGINRVVQARVDGNRGLSSGDEFLGDRNIWFKPFGSWANQGDRNGVSGFNASTYGLVTGIDRAWSEQVRAGVAFAYARSTVDANSTVAPQSSKVDVYQLIGYGSYSLDQDTELNFQGDVSRNSNRSKRNISFTSSVAEGSYDSTGLHVGAGLSRSFALSSATTFTPGVRADYTWIRDAGYAESGAGALNLNVDSRSASQLVLSTEGKLNLQLNQNTSLAFNAGVGYDTINKQASITSAYAGAPGASFVTYGLEQSPWIGRAGAALTYTTNGGVDLSLRYDLETRSSFTNQTASAKARWRF